MTRVLAVVLCVTLAAPGCATMRASRTSIPMKPSQTVPDRAVMTTYLKQLPVGSKVRARLTDGSTIRGTLMKTGDEGIVVQPNARIPEPPRSVPMDQIRAVELEHPGGVGKAIAIGVAVGAGTSFGVLMILAAIFAD